MNHKTRRRIIAALGWIAVTPLLIEMALTVFDPLGVRHYLGDLNEMYSHFREDGQRGYIMQPGDYTFSNWRATILPDSSRTVPDTNLGSPCKIVFLGDSVTFGHGVDDKATWVNLIVQELPIRAVNAGINGYNIDNVQGARRAISGDLYVYLLIDNDTDPPLNWQNGAYHAYNTIIEYLDWYTFSVNYRSAEPDNAFYRALEALLSDPDVTVAAFDTGGLSTDLARRYPIHLIPLWTHPNSRADGHANPEGNREIAAAMLPIVQSAMQKQCTATF